MKSNWEWFGSAGHLCVGEFCRFHLSTKVGEYIVSTAGDYFVIINGKYTKQTLGIQPDSFFETMVFKCSGECECGCGMPDHSGEELDVERYSNRKDANEGHLKMCEKYDT